MLPIAPLLLALAQVGAGLEDQVARRQRADRLLADPKVSLRITDNSVVIGTASAAKAVAASVSSIATSLNAARMRLNWHYNADQTPGEIAAACAAAKLWGDGAAGGVVLGEEAYAASNLNGCTVLDITPQVAIADQPLDTEIEDVLNYGVTPLTPSVAVPGHCKIVKSVTTRALDALANPNYAVHDTSKVTVSDYLADKVEADVGTEFASKNLAAEPSDGSGPTHRSVIFPSHVRAFIGKILYELEALGLLTNVDACDEDLVCEIDTENPSALLVEIPAEVVPHFHGFYGRVVQRA